MTYFRIQDKNFVAFGDINKEGFVNYISGNLKHKQIVKIFDLISVNLNEELKK